MTASLRLALLCVLLLVLSLVTALAIVASTHRSRGLYADLQDLEGRRWYLEEEYSRLLLEQGTWSSHHRIQSEAQEALGLSAPPHDHTRLLPR
jgi:cell division protein FtsL